MKRKCPRAAITLRNSFLRQGCSNRTFFGVSARVFRSLKTGVQLNKKSAAWKSRYLQCKNKNNHSRPTPGCSNYYGCFSWWGMVDSNHRRHSQQIYSLSPLATREIPHIYFCLIGAGRRTRTPDLLITNQLLYQLSYTGGSNRTRLL